MKLIHCHIENFGRLRDFDYVFQEGVNVLCRENGWGKSTFASFLCAMFYGIPGTARGGGSSTRATAARGKGDSTRTKTANSVKSERAMYLPWQGGTFGGSLVFEAGGKEYEMTRIFGRRASEDVFELRDMDTNLPSFDYSEKIGEEIFRLNRESFLRTAFTAQLDCPTAPTDDINALIGDLAGLAGDMSCYEDAISRLSAAAARLTPKRPTGILHRRAEQIAELSRQTADDDLAPRLRSCAGARQEERRRLTELESRHLAAQEELEKARDELEKAQARLEKAQFGLEKAQAATEKAPDGSEKAQAATENAQAATEKAPDGSEKAQAATENTQAATEKAPDGSEKAQADLEKEQIGPERAREGVREGAEKERAEIQGKRHLSQKRLPAREGARASVFSERNTSAILLLIAGAAIAGAGLAAALLSGSGAGTAPAALLPVGAALTLLGAALAASGGIIVKKTAEITGRTASNTGLKRVPAGGGSAERGHVDPGMDELPAREQPGPGRGRVDPGMDELPAREQPGPGRGHVDPGMDELPARQQLLRDAMAHFREARRALPGAQQAVALKYGEVQRMEREILSCRTSLAALEREEAELTELAQERDEELARLRSLLAQQQADETRYRRVTAAADLLRKAKESMTARYAKPLREGFAAGWERITGYSAAGIRVDADTNVTIQEMGRRRDFRELSRGYGDLAGICLRIALADAMYPPGRGERPVLILDDPFVNLDDEKMTGALRFLGDAGTRYQILYLTCSRSRCRSDDPPRTYGSHVFP